MGLLWEVNDKVEGACDGFWNPSYSLKLSQRKHTLQQIEAMEGNVQKKQRIERDDDKDKDNIISSLLDYLLPGTLSYLPIRDSVAYIFTIKPCLTSGWLH